jgi:hypothetical protein
MTPRLYRYVGPPDIAERARRTPPGRVIEAPWDVVLWARETGQELDAEGCITATFVVDVSGRLRLADRRSEHVACAGGGPVLSAGEMRFEVLPGKSFRVAEVSNQSTGYCPEPESWPAVAVALARARLPAPQGFTPACVFRRCPNCGGRNIVKDGIFVCGVCAAELPAAWNCDED